MNQLKAVFAIIRVSPGKILVVSRGKPHVMFGLIGGGEEPGETSIQALIREIFEECGLRMTEDQFIELFTAPPSEKSHVSCTCFATKDYIEEARSLDNKLNAEGNPTMVVTHEFICDPSNTPWPKWNQTAIAKCLALT